MVRRDSSTMVTWNGSENDGGRYTFEPCTFINTGRKGDIKAYERCKKSNENFTSNEKSAF